MRLRPLGRSLTVILVRPFDGLESIHLALGYSWDPVICEVGSARISYREGKRNVIWAFDLPMSREASETIVTPTPIAPSMPQFVLRGEEYGAQGRRVES